MSSLVKNMEKQVVLDMVKSYYLYKKALGAENEGTQSKAGQGQEQQMVMRPTNSDKTKKQQQTATRQVPQALDY